MLGPPVCVDCKKIFDHLEEDEFQELRKTYPEIGRWWCSKCKKLDTADYILTVSRELYEKLTRIK